MNKLVVEFLGSFFLVFTITLVGLQGLGLMGNIAVGTILTALIYAGAHISRAHYNPAVTLAYFIRGKISFSEVPGYILAQLLGSVFSSALVSFVMLNKSGNGMDLNTNLVPALIAELLGTLILVYVYLQVGTSRSTEGNAYHGTAIGFSVLALGMILSPISGAALNPGVALGLGISGISGFGNLWIYWIAEIVGAVAAAYCFLFVNGRE